METERRGKKEREGDGFLRGAADKNFGQNLLSERRSVKMAGNHEETSHWPQLVELLEP